MRKVNIGSVIETAGVLFAMLLFACVVLYLLGVALVIIWKFVPWLYAVFALVLGVSWWLHAKGHPFVAGEKSKDSEYLGPL